MLGLFFPSHEFTVALKNEPRKGSRKKMKRKYASFSDQHRQGPHVWQYISLWTSFRRRSTAADITSKR